MPKILGPEEKEGNVAYQLAHIHDNRGPSTVISVAVLSVLATIAVVLRVMVRWRTRSAFGTDDHLIFLTLLLSWGSFVSVLLRQHVVALKPAQFVGLTKALLFEAPTFQIAVMLNQLSVLFLYKRVFTLSKKWFKYSSYAIGLFCIGAGVSLFFAGLFHCTPINFGWNPTVKGHCGVKIQKLYIAATILNLVGDICVVAVPIPLIWSLHMTLATKTAVSGMFLLGGFVTVINLIKLVEIIIVPLADFTWSDVPVAIWTHAELCLGIVSACLPCYRPLFKSIHNIFSTSASKSKSSTLTPQIRSKASVDAYKTLDGKETDVNGSKTALFPQDQWENPSLPGHSSKVQNVAVGSPPHGDIELGVIGVTRDVDISRSKAKQ